MKAKKGSLAAVAVAIVLALLGALFRGGTTHSGADDAPSGVPVAARAAPGPANASAPATSAPDALRIRLSPKRRAHVLDGDRTGGGHGPGRNTPGKSMFPDSMTDAQVVAEIERIANDPRSYDGGRTPAGAGRVEAFGDVRAKGGGSFRVKVVVEPRGEGVVTAYPVKDQRGR